MESEGRRLHAEAAKAREEGDLPKALSFVFQALAAYHTEGDQQGFSEVLSDASIGIRNKGELEEAPGYLIVAKKFIEASIETAQISNNQQTLALPYFNLGKIEGALGNHQDSVDAFQKAVEIMGSSPPERHNKPAVLADMNIHLATAQYVTGDKSAQERSEQALEDLINAEGATPYEKGVWVSGAHMDIAKMLKDDEPTKAKEHLQKAKEIIDANPELKIRKEQWEKLAATF